MTTILHISDIHRTPNAEVSNIVLFDSLVRDLKRQGISRVDLIIVSGDVVQGVKSVESQADAKLVAQYAEAAEFLGKLADALLGGDRTRIIIVPGNHDINWNASLRSMTALPNGVGEELKKQLAQVHGGRSKIRWSWETLGFYHISDEAVYAKRMEHFSCFISAFYGGQQAFPSDDDKQYKLHVFSEHRLVVLALNSCWNNDHLQFTGQVRNECIALAATELRQLGLTDHLLIATWHHNIRGLPFETGYLDYRCLEYLLDAGVALGLHGHQHLSEVLTEQSRVMRGRRMLIVSAGSLCAGPNELPSGERRSYNVIRISDNNERLTVATRVSVSQDTFAPIWTADAEGEVEAVLPTVEAVPPIHAAKRLDEASDLLRQKRPQEALVILQALPASSNTRRLRLECYLETDNADAVVREFCPPSTTTEAIAVLDAAWKLRRRDIIASVVDAELLRNSNDPALRQVRDKFQRLLGSAL